MNVKMPMDYEQSKNFRHNYAGKGAVLYNSAVALRNGQRIRLELYWIQERKCRMFLKIDDNDRKEHVVFLQESLYREDTEIQPDLATIEFARACDKYGAHPAHKIILEG